MKVGIRLALSMAILLLATATMVRAATLDQVKKKGYINCGVSHGLPGFSNPDEKGGWSGLDVEYCRAVALAVFNDPKAVKFRPLNAKDRFAALTSGEVDILSRNTTWTLTRDTSVGINFPGVIFYDGQGFLVRKSLGVAGALELNGASICLQTGTTTELNLSDYFVKNKMKFEIVAYEDNSEAIRAYDQGRCDTFTSDSSGLYGIRLRLTNPDDHVILPEIISKEPLGPAVRQGDDQWYNITMWTLFSLFQAEELGINSKNIEEMSQSTDPRIQRFLGLAGNDLGGGLGLKPQWVYFIIKGLGNYGEIFDRTVGKDSPLKIARGLNKPWTDGGLQYSPPFR